MKTVSAYRLATIGFAGIPIRDSTKSMPNRVGSRNQNPLCSHHLVRSRIPAFQAGDTGSNPVGSTRNHIGYNGSGSGYCKRGCNPCVIETHSDRHRDGPLSNIDCSCPAGGTGRHDRFRFYCRKASRFESGVGHKGN